MVIEDPRFKEAIEFVLKHEGNLSDDKDDPGGITNYGISLRFLENSNIDINNDKKIDSKDIVSLTKEQAISLYKKEFWDKYNFNNLINLKIAKKIFDMSVSLGPKMAITLFQEAINTIDTSSPITVDGILGSQTINRANLLSEDFYLLHTYIIKIASYYYDLTYSNKKLNKYIKGWIYRAYDN